MRWDVELAKQFKKRDNKRSMGPQIGEVLSVNPLKISILGNKAVLTEAQCYICSNVVEHAKRKAGIVLGDVAYEGEITYKEVLKTGDSVLCLPAEDGQVFFILDKVVY